MFHAWYGEIPIDILFQYQLDNESYDNDHNCKKSEINLNDNQRFSMGWRTFVLVTRAGHAINFQDHIM